jgi:hypothetical protein
METDHFFRVLLKQPHNVSPKTHNVILTRNMMPFVKSREIQRDSEKYPMTCSFRLMSS